MDVQLSTLRSAINAFYCSGENRRNVEAWLQRFRGIVGSWQLCLRLLSLPGAQEHELLFAANSLKTVACKSTEVLEAATLHELVSKLGLEIQTALHRGSVAQAEQLASALATLAVRAQCWSPSSILLDLQALFPRADPSLAAAAAAAGAGGAAAALSAAGAPAGVHDPVALLALLHVLVALPEALSCRQASLHPDRRAAVVDSLSASPWAAPLAATGLRTRRPEPVLMACRCVAGWCELGWPPLGLDRQADALEVAWAALLGEDTAGVAADALCALLAACGDAGSGAADARGAGALLPLLLSQLQGALLPALASAPPGGLPPAVQQAVVRVLCAAAAALLRPALAAGGAPLALLAALQEQLLGALSHPSDDVALTALHFWQESYLGALRALHGSGGAAAATLLAVQQQQPVLEALTAALIRRTQLTPAAAAAATADARDLPEDIRAVRRELASALRDITALLGLPAMCGYLVRLVAAAFAHTVAAAGGGGAAGGVGPSPLTANVRDAGAGGAASCEWLPLESGVYAANVVLGRRSGDAGADQVAQLVALGAASVTQPGGSPKLAGTALTLLGGLGAWYCSRPGSLAGVLAAVAAALRSPDAKLARNGATCVQRLCAHDGLCRLICAQHGGWVASLLQLYQAKGGLVRRSQGPGEDAPAEELLLVSLCCLAVASSTPGDATALLMRLIGPQLAAAEAEAAAARADAAVHGGAPGGAAPSGDDALGVCIGPRLSFLMASGAGGGHDQQRRTAFSGGGGGGGRSASPPMHGSGIAFARGLEGHHGGGGSGGSRSAGRSASSARGGGAGAGARSPALAVRPLPAVVRCLSMLAALVEGLPTGVAACDSGGRDGGSGGGARVKGRGGGRGGGAALAGARAANGHQPREDSSRASFSETSSMVSTVDAPLSGGPGSSAAHEGRGASRRAAAAVDPDDSKARHARQLVLTLLRAAWPLVRRTLELTAAGAVVGEALPSACALLTLALPVAAAATADEMSVRRGGGGGGGYRWGSESGSTVSGHSSLASSDTAVSFGALGFDAGDGWGGGCGGAAAAAAASASQPSGAVLLERALQELGRLDEAALQQTSCLELISACVGAVQKLQAASAAGAVAASPALHAPAPIGGGGGGGLFGQPLFGPPPVSHLFGGPGAGAGSSLFGSVGSGWGSSGFAPQLGRTSVASAMAAEVAAAAAALQQLLSKVIGSHAAAALAADGRADPAATAALLRLAASALEVAPEAVLGAGGGRVPLLLALTRLVCRTYDQEQCGAALEWVAALATAPYAQEGDGSPHGSNRFAASPLLAVGGPAAHPASAAALGAAGWPGAAAPWALWGGAPPAAAAAPSPPRASPAASAALSALRASLEGGAGAQLALALLLAAGGDMPPDAVLAVAVALHRVWLGVGTPVAAAWLEAAVLQLAPEDAPWAGHKPAARAAWVRELLDPAGAPDVSRFKRSVKAFCGGKKKGGGTPSGGGGG